jgi:IMP dehydrogenase
MASFLDNFEIPGGDGYTADQLFGAKRSSCSAFTYDDIIIMPGHISYSENPISLEGHITRKIKVKLPLLSSPMDTVTEHKMAIGMALQGAIGIIHYNMTVEEQAREVRLVKKYKNGFITDPVILSPEHSIADVDQLKEQFGFSGFPITVDGKLGSKLVGIVTNRDIDYIEDRSMKLREVMTTELHTGAKTFQLKYYSFDHHVFS